MPDCTVAQYIRTVAGNARKCSLTLRDAIRNLVTYTSDLDTEVSKAFAELLKATAPKCRVCGCTDDDCRACIAETGMPCHWVLPDLCSRCVGTPPKPPRKRASKR